MKIVHILCFVLFACFSSTSFAIDDKVQNTDSVILPIYKGQPSPYDGVVLTHGAVSSIVADYKLLDENLKLELQNLKLELEAKHQFEIKNLKTTCDADKETLNLRLLNADKREKRLIQDLKKAEAARPNLFLWIGGTAVGTTIVTSLLYFVVLR